MHILVYQKILSILLWEMYPPSSLSRNFRYRCQFFYGSFYDFLFTSPNIIQLLGDTINWFLGIIYLLGITKECTVTHLLDIYECVCIILFLGEVEAVRTGAVYCWGCSGALRRVCWPARSWASWRSSRQTNPPWRQAQQLAVYWRALCRPRSTCSRPGSWSRTEGCWNGSQRRSRPGMETFHWVEHREVRRRPTCQCRSQPDCW